MADVNMTDAEFKEMLRVALMQGKINILESRVRWLEAVVEFMHNTSSAHARSPADIYGTVRLQPLAIPNTAYEGQGPAAASH